MTEHPRGLEWTFDTVPELYEKMRPGYPRELYQDIFSLAPLDETSRALEIGIGGGQATLPILKTGARVTAVEYGENFSRLCREKFAAFPGFSVINQRFEEAELEENRYDLIYSASAFHWIPEEIGYRKVFALLKPGGVFARFANHANRNREQEELNQAIQRLYDQYMPGNRPPREYGEDWAASLAEIAGNYGFRGLSWRIYRRTRTFSPEEYTALLGTYSDHLALEEHTRRRFFSEIAGAIERFSGEITLYDTIDLELAQKPPV